MTTGSRLSFPDLTLRLHPFVHAINIINNCLTDCTLIQGQTTSYRWKIRKSDLREVVIRVMSLLGYPLNNSHDRLI